MISGLGPRSRQNQSQEARLGDFLVLAPEVEKISSRRLDLVTFWSWLQMSIKLVIRVDLMTFWYFVVVADELCTYKFWTYINIGVHMYLFML